MQDCMRKVDTKAVMTVRTKFAILLIVSRFIKLNFLKVQYILQGCALLDFSYLLWRKERSKETSTYPKSFPIWKDLTEEWQRPLILRLFWYRGTRDELFIGCAMRDDAGHAMGFYRLRWRLDS